MLHKLIRIEDEFWLLENEKPKSIGDFFGERHLTGDWWIYRVDTENDLAHDGFKILASTRELDGVYKLDKDKILALVKPNKQYTAEDIRAAMFHMVKYMKYEKQLPEYNPLVVIDGYSEAIANEWVCEVDLKITNTVISGGFRTEGKIGGPGLKAHHTFAPRILDGKISIKWIK